MSAGNAFESLQSDDAGIHINKARKKNNNNHHLCDCKQIHMQVIR